MGSYCLQKIVGANIFLGEGGVLKQLVDSLTLNLP